MQESVTYQDILHKGAQQGRLEGRREATLSLVMRQLTRRLGAFNPQLQERLQRLSLEQLEELGEALLDFQTAADLGIWLEKHQLVSLLLRQLTHRFGEVESRLQEQVWGLSLLSMEELGEALLDFQTVADLAVWLDEHQPEENGDSEALLRSADHSSPPND